ncbi:unnamed protein product [Phaeothamnion confervicola]
MDTTDAPQLIEHAHKTLAFTPYEVRWVPCSARFVVGGVYPRAKGALLTYELDGGGVKLLEEVEKPAGIKCMTFGASSYEDRHVACGDYDGRLAIYDLERRNDPPVYSAQAHSTIINAVDGVGGPEVGYGAPELVTGGRDGCVRVWDPRVPQPVLALEPDEGQTARDCWTVAFGDSYSDQDRCVAAGYDNGDLKLFDLRANAVRWETNVSNGVTCVEFDRKDIEMNKLVVTTLESKFRVFDLRTQHPEHGFASLSEKAHKATVWLARHLPQNRDIFMTGGGNGGFNLYKYHYPASRTRVRPGVSGNSGIGGAGLPGADERPTGVAGTVELLNSRVVSSQPIVSFDWSPDKEGLCALASVDQAVRVFIVTKLGKY